VYLLERHYTAAGQLYHRRCYRSFQRTAPLQKSKQHSDKETADRPTANGSVPSCGKTGVGSSSTNTNSYTPSSGTGAARDGRLTNVSSLQSAVGSSSVAGKNRTSPSQCTGLLRALFTPPDYKQTAAAAVESVSSAVTAVGRSMAASATSGSVSVASTTYFTSKSGPQNLKTVTDVTRSLTGSRQSVSVAAIKSQYLQRVGGVSAPAVVTSTPTTISVASYSAGRVARNITSAAPAVLEPASGLDVVSGLYRPLVSSSRPQTGDGMKVVGSEVATSHRPFAGISFTPYVTAAASTSVASRSVSRSSVVSKSPPVAVTVTFNETSNSGSHVSPFVKDRLRTPTTRTSHARSVLATSSTYASSLKSVPVTSPHPVTSVSASSAYTNDRVRPSQLSAAAQHSSAKNGAEGAQRDSAMVSSILQSLAAARERKEPSQLEGSSAVRHSPAESTMSKSSPNIAALTTSPGGRGTPGTAVSNKTEWQLEVERRHAARNGAYIDPEKQPKAARQQYRSSTHASVSAMHLAVQPQLQQTGLKQPRDREDSSYRSTLSNVSQSTVAAEGHTKRYSGTMHSPLNNADAVVMRNIPGKYSGMYQLRPTAQQVQSPAAIRQQRRFTSKKSASNAFQ